MKNPSACRPCGTALKMLALAVGTIGSTASHAAAFQLMEGNASGLGNAYAGSAAVAEDASTVFFNPAGMSLLPGRNVAFSVDLVRPSAKFDNQGTTGALLNPPGTNEGGDAGDLAFVPAGYFTMQLTDTLTFGLGVGAPFGLKTEYDSDWIGRFYAVKSEIKTVNVNPSLSFKVNDRFSVGAGVNFQRIDADLTSAVNYGGIVAASGGGASSAGATGLARIKGDDTAWGWNVGMIFKLTDDMRLGLAYRSKMDYTLTGTARFTSPAGGDLVDQAIIDGFNAARAGRIRAEVELPDIATFSVHQRLSDRWTMMGDISWTGWSSLQELRVDNIASGENVTTEQLSWRDTWRVAFGGTYAYNDAINLKFGLAWDQTPVRESTRLPRVPDEDRIWLSLGVQWKPTQDSAVDVGYAHLFVKDASVNNNGGDLVSQTLKGTLIGEYENSVDILGVQYSTRF